MIVPEPLYISSSLTAAYGLLDGSRVEVDRDGGYRITDASGTVLVDTIDRDAEQMRFGMPPADYGEIMDDLAAFLVADITRYDDEDGIENNFTDEVAAWAKENEDELSELANYREDRRLAEIYGEDR